jgi:O-antigen ligase
MSRRTAVGEGASGTAGGPSLSPRARRRERRRERGEAAAAEYVAGPSATIPLIPLALVAAGLPLFVWNSLADGVVMPRLVASVWLAGAALLALSWLGAWSRIRWNALALPSALLGAFLFLSALSAAFGVDSVRSVLGEVHRYQGLLPLFMYAAMMLAAMTATAYAGTPRVLLIGAFVGGALGAAYGFIQWAGWDWVTWAGVPSGQIGGAFAQPEVLGLELIVAAAASTALLPDAAPRVRAVVLAGIALMLFVALLTLSRGAFVGGAAAVAVLALLHAGALRDWRRYWYVAPAVVVLAGAFLLLPQGRDTLGRGWHRMGSARNFTDTSISQRVGLWHLSLEMAADHPIIGSGPDAFPQLFASYRTQDQPGLTTQNVRPESSHNLFLDRLVDGGVLGLAAFLALLGACAWLGLRALPRLGPVRRAEMAALLAGLAGYYAATFFFYGEAMTGWIPWVFLGAVAGLASTVAPEEEDDEAAPKAPPWQAPAVRIGWGALGVLLLAVGLSFTYADYRASRAYNEATGYNLDAAMDSARASTRWNPLQPSYLLALGRYREAAAQNGRTDAEAKALDAYHTLNTRFDPTSETLAAEAQAQANVAFKTPQDQKLVFDLLERAVKADPNNADVRQGIVDFYKSVGEDARAKPHEEWLAQARAMGDAPPAPPPAPTAVPSPSPTAAPGAVPTAAP